MTMSVNKAGETNVWLENVNVWSVQAHGFLKTSNPASVCSHPYFKQKLKIAVFCMFPFIICPSPTLTTTSSSLDHLYAGIDIKLMRGPEERFGFHLVFEPVMLRTYSNSTTSIVGGVRDTKIPDLYIDATTTLKPEWNI